MLPVKMSQENTLLKIVTCDGPNDGEEMHSSFQYTRTISLSSLSDLFTPVNNNNVFMMCH